jgi:hypothetical protein
MKHLAAAMLLGAGVAAWTLASAREGRQSDPLDSFQGTWRLQVRTWPAPGGSPTEKILDVERRLAQGLLQTFPSDPASRDWLPFHALHHNTRAARYESVFSNPAGPELVLLTGQADGAGKTIILTGSPDSRDGGRWKEVHTVVNESTTRTEFFHTPQGGREWLVIEMTFTKTGRRDDPIRRPDPGAPRPVIPPTHPIPRPPEPHH